MIDTKGKLFATCLTLAVTAAACSDPEVNSPEPNLSHIGPFPMANHVFVCKIGSAASFDVVNGDVANVSLNDGECAEVASHPGDQTAIDVTITETVLPAGVVLKQVRLQEFFADDRPISDGFMTGPSVTVSLQDDKYWIVTYENLDVMANGRMTGGGGQLQIDGARITRGLTLHCDIILSNNLQINWPGGNKWHLEKESLSSVSCIDDPAYNPVPPAAPFDTFIAEAVGSLNGVDGSVIRFKFIDDGEPGKDGRSPLRNMGSRG